MFLTSEPINDSPQMAPFKLAIPKDQALRKTQELFLLGRQVNALYICTHDELKTAELKKLEFIGTAHDILSVVCETSACIDFFDGVSINVLKDSAPIEALSELFHNEMNQRLERLRIIRREIEQMPGPAASEMTSVARPAEPVELGAEPVVSFRQPVPQPQPVSISDRGGNAVPSPADPGVSSESATEKPPRKAAMPLQQEPLAVVAAMRAKAKSASVQQRLPLDRTKIMLILASRNGTARQALCRFANQMNLTFEIVDYNPEQPHQIVEQIYRHRDAKFAVVYWGEPTGRELPGSAHPERYVGYALGFALGRLGRARVFVMGSTTTPPLPGFNRILVSQLDSAGGWQIQLARRMKAAGLDIDLNLLSS